MDDRKALCFQLCFGWLHSVADAIHLGTTCKRLWDILRSEQIWIASYWKDVFAQEFGTRLQKNLGIEKITYDVFKKRAVSLWNLRNGTHRSFYYRVLLPGKFNQFQQRKCHMWKNYLVFLTYESCLVYDTISRKKWLWSISSRDNVDTRQNYLAFANLKLRNWKLIDVSTQTVVHQGALPPPPQSGLEKKEENRSVTVKLRDGAMLVRNERQLLSINCNTGEVRNISEAKLFDRVIMKDFVVEKNDNHSLKVLSFTDPKKDFVIELEAPICGLKHSKKYNNCLIGWFGNERPPIPKRKCVILNLNDDPVVAKEFEIEVKEEYSDLQFMHCDFNNTLMVASEYCFTDVPQANWVKLPDKSLHNRVVFHDAILTSYQNRLSIFFPQNEKLYSLSMPEMDLTIAKFFVVPEEENIRLVAFTGDPCPVIAVWDFSGEDAPAGKKKRKKAQIEILDFSKVTRQ